MLWDEKEMADYLEKIITLEALKVEEDAKEYLVFSSGGDVRAMLNSAGKR